MGDCLYRVRWILNPLDPNRAGFFGTTNHAGHSPAAAAVASAEAIRQSIEESWGRVQLVILGVSAEQDDANLLSGTDLQMALRRADDSLTMDVVYRPLC